MSAMVKATIPVLPASDVAASLAWWVEVCGFTEIFRDATPPSYAGIVRDAATLHLAKITEASLARVVGKQTMVRIVVDKVEVLFAEYRQQGGVVHPNGGLHTTPWGTREFSAIDPNGVCVTFLS